MDDNYTDDPVTSIGQADLLKDPDLRQAIAEASGDGGDESDPLAGSASNGVSLDLDKAYEDTHGTKPVDGAELDPYTTNTADREHLED